MKHKVVLLLCLALALIICTPASRRLLLFGDVNWTPSQVGSTVGLVPFKAHDNGDGSYSNTVYANGGSAAATVADGGDVTQGAIADSAAAAGGTGTVSAKLRETTSLLNTINTTLGTPFQAGGSIGNTIFASTVADGANVTAGSKADAAATQTDTTAVSAISILKEISKMEQAPASRVVQQSQFSVLDAQFGAATNHAAKASAGTLTTITVSSTDANLVYLQIFNTTSVPGGGTTPLLSFPIGPGGPNTPTYLSIGENVLGVGGISMATGISWGISSTNATYTATGDSASLFNVTVIGS